MTNPVVYYILLLLDANGSVFVPGLGRFVQRRTGAQLDTDRDLIIPPYSTTSFDRENEENDDDLLARFISFKTGTLRDEASGMISGFSSRVIVETEREGKLNVRGLGVFNQEDGRMVFKPDPQTENSRYAALDIVSLRALSGGRDRKATGGAVAIQATKTTSTDPVTSPVAEELSEVDASESSEALASAVQRAQNAPSARDLERERRRKIPLILPIFFLMFIVVTVLAVMQYRSRTAMMHPAAVFNRPPVEDSSITDSSSEGAQKNTFGVAPESEIPDPDKDAVGEPETERVPHKSLGAAPYEESPQDEHGESADSAMGSDLITSGPTAKPSVTEEIMASNNPCFVVVGAFGVQRNVERMTERLAAEGYSAVTLPRGELTQVAILSECGSTEISQILEDVRMNIESAAWIFKR